MIASVRGRVQHIGLDKVVVEVGGIGMLVHTTPATASALHLGREATLSSTLVVREESLTLFGFGSDDERDLFEQVQTVSGVGPRIALAMLSVLDPDRLRGAISGGDLATLTKVPGIGRKGAERLVLELRDKMAPTGASTSTPAPATGGATSQDQVVEALVGLGYSAKQADDAVTRALEHVPADTGVSELLRAALRGLGR